MNQAKDACQDAVPVRAFDGRAVLVLYPNSGIQQGKHRFNTIGLPFIMQQTVKPFQFSYFFVGQCTISHIACLLDTSCFLIEKAEIFNREQYKW
ncbi:MAG: hypothetical protein J7K65_01935 [Planctomycetes bacterium]|nr:hypothetical protein [Planctomycetota bacterium]